MLMVLTNFIASDQAAVTQSPGAVVVNVAVILGVILTIIVFGWRVYTSRRISVLPHFEIVRTPDSGNCLKWSVVNNGFRAYTLQKLTFSASGIKDYSQLQRDFDDNAIVVNKRLEPGAQAEGIITGVHPWIFATDAQVMVTPSSKRSLDFPLPHRGPVRKAWHEYIFSQLQLRLPEYNVKDEGLWVQVSKEGKEVCVETFGLFLDPEGYVGTILDANGSAEASEIVAALRGRLPLLFKEAQGVSDKALCQWSNKVQRLVEKGLLPEELSK